MSSHKNKHKRQQKPAQLLQQQSPLLEFNHYKNPEAYGMPCHFHI